MKESIGPRVLLYGMSVWKGRNENEVLHRFHRDGAITSGCQKTINFVSGANVQLISQSHKIPERLSQALLRSLLLIEDESLKLPNKENQLAFLENVSKIFHKNKTSPTGETVLNLETVFFSHFGNGRKFGNWVPSHFGNA